MPLPIWHVLGVENVEWSLDVKCLMEIEKLFELKTIKCRRIIWFVLKYYCTWKFVKVAHLFTLLLAWKLITTFIWVRSFLLLLFDFSKKFYIIWHYDAILLYRSLDSVSYQFKRESD